MKPALRATASPSPVAPYGRPVLLASLLELLIMVEDVAPLYKGGVFSAAIGAFFTNFRLAAGQGP